MSTFLRPLPPPMRGTGTLPRHGSGWMHQFGHVYALQQEMLHKRNDWFRACELWHAARVEGLALNTDHYGTIARQLATNARWVEASSVVRVLQRDALRPDVDTIGSLMWCFAKSGQWRACCEAHRVFVAEPRKRATSQIKAALSLAYLKSGQWHEALEMARTHNLPEAERHLLLEESASALEPQLAEVFATNLRRRPRALEITDNHGSR